MKFDVSDLLFILLKSDESHLEMFVLKSHLIVPRHTMNYDVMRRIIPTH